jgi:hypothetical protein
MRRTGKVYSLKKAIRQSNWEKESTKLIEIQQLGVGPAAGTGPKLAELLA